MAKEDLGGCTARVWDVGDCMACNVGAVIVLDDGSRLCREHAESKMRYYIHFHDRVQKAVKDEDEND